MRRTKQKAAVAQSVERRIGSAEVTGPIPVSSSEWKPENLEKRFSGFLFNRKLRFLLNKNAPQGGTLRAKENGCWRSRAPARVCAVAHTFLASWETAFPRYKSFRRIHIPRGGKWLPPQPDCGTCVRRSAYFFEKNCVPYVQKASGEWHSARSAEKDSCWNSSVSAGMCAAGHIFLPYQCPSVRETGNVRKFRLPRHYCSGNGSAGNLPFIRFPGKRFPAPVFPPSVNHPQPCVDHKPAQSRRGHIDHVSPENPHSQGDLVENDLLGGIVGGKVEHGDVGFRAGSPVDGQSC